MHKEIFMLYRNSTFYQWSVERSALVQVIKENPDFTHPQDGVMPTATIVRYVSEREGTVMPEQPEKPFRLVVNGGTVRTFATLWEAEWEEARVRRVAVRDGRTVTTSIESN